MAIDLGSFIAPPHTAVVTVEMQRAVIGDLASIPDIAVAAREAGIVARTALMLEAARSAGVRVVHCVAEYRADSLGSAVNCPLLAALFKAGAPMVAGTPRVELVADLGAKASDVVCSRSSGISPFGGTNLDATLRALGVKVLVVAGVSVNVALLGLVIEAVNHGYSVVLPTDCVAGIPKEYADAVIKNTLSMLAMRTVSGKVIEIWSGHERP
jgi:nicotinamidase-related amidase